MLYVNFYRNFDRGGMLIGQVTFILRCNLPSVRDLNDYASIDKYIIHVCNLLNEFTRP